MLDTIFLPDSGHLAILNKKNIFNKVCEWLPFHMRMPGMCLALWEKGLLRLKSVPL
jgi:hypothetical protein